MRNYKFFRKETGEWEDVTQEEWFWEAVYEDGNRLLQFDENGMFHQFGEIDQSKLAVFKMRSEKHSQSYTLLFSDPKMKLIHYYRNVVLNAATEDEKRVRFYCFGYEKEGVRNKNQKLVMIITPNNELITTENPDLVLVS